MTLAEHLAEIRKRFLLSMVTIIVFGIVSFLLYPQILHILQGPYCRAVPRHCTFLVTNPLDGLTLRVKIAFFGGLLFSSPVLLWHVWRFITPGLQARERKYAIPFVASSMIFFLAGAAVAYYSFGHAIAFLQSIGGKTLISDYNPNQYLSLFLMMMFIFGVTFEFPVILVAIELAGLVTPAQLLKSWRYALIGITVAAAVFTPSGDPLSMMALALPLTAFYFLSIAVGKFFRK